MIFVLIKQSIALGEAIQIVVRMPNWLGDMTMATAFIHALKQAYPVSVVDIIVKTELAGIAAYIPGVGTIHRFSKKENSSRSFGKQLRRYKKYDIFFCLPNSFSSAQMAFYSRAVKRVGFKKEMRSLLLTDSYKRPAGMHRVDEYLYLLSSFVKQGAGEAVVELVPKQTFKRDAVVVNINSEAVSRRLPPEKAVEIINVLRQEIANEIILVGSPKEQGIVAGLYDCLADTKNITNLAGKTTIESTIELMASVKAVLTTDSGPAHLSNAVGTPTIVLFGAGDENSTGPYNKAGREIIRLGKLPCEKCVSNTCKVYGEPKCLQDLEAMQIVLAVKKYL